MIKRVLIGLCLLILLFPASLIAELKLPDLFCDHMVLQRNAPIPIWGRAKESTTVTVSLGSTSIAFTADSEGTWVGHLPAMPAGGPFLLMIVNEEDTIRIQDVYLGEVWLCSGQSNMEWPLRKSAEAAMEIPEADHPMIRFYQLQKRHDTYSSPYSLKEIEDFTAGKFFYQPRWKVCAPIAAADFSAVAYHFGKVLYDSLKVPIGLIQATVGGSPAQSWISKEALANHPQLEHLVAEGKSWLASPIIHPWLAVRATENWANYYTATADALPGHPFAPGYLFDSAIKTLTPYGLKGSIWYQGESNATHPESYPAMMKALIDTWRGAFQRGDLPFYFVQLPRISNRSRWPEFREAQRQLLTVPKTGMIVTIDQGHPTDVHPREKKTIGQRLAHLALAKTYNFGINAENPSLQTYTWKPDGNTITLHFSHAYGGLSQSGEEEISGFTIQGYTNQGSTETIICPKSIEIYENTIVLSYPEGFLPTKVKYAWAPFPKAKLANAAGLPLGPFKLELSGSN